MDDFSTRLRRARLNMDLNQVEMGKKLGLTGNHVSRLERGARPSPQTEAALERIEQDLRGKYVEGPLVEGPRIREEASPLPEEPPFEGAIRLRHVPLISWEEIDAEMEEILDRLCRTERRQATDLEDKEAWSVEVATDEMEPRIKTGQKLVLSPALEMKSKCMILARRRGDAVLFRKMEWLDQDGGRMRLTAFNSELYPPIDCHVSDFAWLRVVAQVVWDAY